MTRFPLRSHKTKILRIGIHPKNLRDRTFSHLRFRSSAEPRKSLSYPFVSASEPVEHEFSLTFKELINLVLESAGSPSCIVGAILYQFGIYCSKIGWYLIGQRQLILAYELRKKRLGMSHPLTIETANLLISVCYVLNDAETIEKVSLEILTQNLDSVSKEEFVKRLSGVFLSRGKMEIAQRILTRHLDQAVSEEDFESQCSSLILLASHGLKSDNLSLSHESLARAKKIVESHLPQYHPTNIERIAVEAEFLKKQGQLDLALETIQTALQIVNKFPKKNFRRLKPKLYWVRGEIYQELMELKKALRDYSLGLKLMESILGLEDPLLIFYLLPKGFTLYLLKRFYEAEPIFERAARIHEYSPFPDQTSLLWTYSLLGDIQYELKKYSEAEETIRKAINLSSEIKSDIERVSNSVRLLLIQNCRVLALCLAELGQEEEALIFARKASENSVFGDPDFEINKQFLKDLEDRLSN